MLNHDPQPPGNTSQLDEGPGVDRHMGEGSSRRINARVELVRELLRYVAATNSASPVRREFGWRWNEVDDLQFRHAMDAGLAPLLWRLAQETTGPVPAAWSDTLKASDLMARIVYGNMRDAAVEIIDACRERGVRVTLLKGISIGDQHYPAAHLRPMGDVDLLVAKGDRDWVEAMMLDRGYARMTQFHEGVGAPHGAPLFLRERRVWVEIHTGLFPEDDRLRGNELFSSSQIESQTVASTFQGRPVGRLTEELQLAYIASYWIRDLQRDAFHASGARPLFDATYLLKASGSQLDWDAMLGFLDNDLAAASLYVLLSFLSTQRLDSSASRILPRLASTQGLVGAPELRILSAMIDASLVGGRPFLGRFGERHTMIARSVLNSLLAHGTLVGKLMSLPWNIVFPSWIPERYTFRYQHQRLRRLLFAER